MAKTIITVALTGAATPKSKNPALPCTPKEIAADAIACWKKGAAIVHLHMRDEELRGTMDKERFRETVNIIRGETDLICNLSSSGESGAPNMRRMEHIIELKPELATFDAASINLANGAIFMNKADFLMELGAAMIENGVKPEVEIMDLGFLAAADYYQAKGVLKAPIHYQFVLGFFCPPTPHGPPSVSALRICQSCMPPFPWAVTSASVWRTTSITPAAFSPPTLCSSSAPPA